MARALDIVGDRWTLLIVRELLILRQARFTDLQNGLPGIAPNLLSQRLRDLQDHGLIRTEVMPPPATGTAYLLTERGRDLEGVVRELLKWGAPTVPSAPADALFQMHWLSLPVKFLLRDHEPGEAPVTIRFGDLRNGFDLTASAGTTSVEPCRPDANPAVTVNGPGPALVGLIQGMISLSDAARAGITVTGDPSALRRVLQMAE
ncbi:MAG: winged helix-turn-helix transcriptional regulator [Propionibacteriaceae bacterium]